MSKTLYNQIFRYKTEFLGIGGHGQIKKERVILEFTAFYFFAIEIFLHNTIIAFITR